MKHLALLLLPVLAFAQAPKQAEPKPAPKVAQAPKATGLVGNKDSKTYHKADCPAAAKMKAENKVALPSKAEAETQGYKACKNCKP